MSIDCAVRQYSGEHCTCDRVALIPSRTKFARLVCFEVKKAKI